MEAGEDPEDGLACCMEAGGDPEDGTEGTGAKFLGSVLHPAKNTKTAAKIKKSIIRALFIYSLR
jgi:hypothetical protein